MSFIKPHRPPEDAGRFKRTSPPAFFMSRALELAAKARGKTSPNPMVGAVMVKGGKILAEGYHHRAGLPHAEVEVLKKVSTSQAKGSTLYVTLEPCSHFGLTPPCADLLIEKGVRKVVVAHVDPNPLVSGKGIQRLRKSGIEVEVGLLSRNAKALNKVFLSSITRKLPFVTLKSAFTLDGYLATVTGDSKWISSEKSRKYVQRLRKEVDGLLTSSSTVLADHPHLGVRGSRGSRGVRGCDPLRIILDSKLRTSPRELVYRDSNVLVATTTDSLEKRRELFRKAGIELLIYPGSKVPLRRLLHDLYKRQITSVLIEAGGELTTAFLKEELVQEVVFFIAPKILGEGKSFVRSLGLQRITEALPLNDVQVRMVGPDILLTGSLKTKSL